MLKLLLGSDDLAGTIDDVDILKVELLLNGKSLGFMDKPILGGFFYTKQIDHNLSESTN